MYLCIYIIEKCGYSKFQTVAFKLEIRCTIFKDCRYQVRNKMYHILWRSIARFVNPININKG